MTKPTTIIFDCFGVIYQDAFKQFLEDHVHELTQPRGHYYDLAKQNELGFLSDDGFYQAFAADTGLPAGDIKRTFNDVNCLNGKVVELLQELQATRQYKIGMLTNIERSFLQKFLDNHGIGHLFDQVLASSETAHVKPEREIFEVMEARIGTPFGEWYFVDDSQTNIEAARSYGIAGHVFTDTGDLREALHQADILV